ncbi:hypothetical protein, partial [Nocardia brasiliensis]|uniref:hypothetical protein n=1 Tax=Nocardia brasiliensis TaxID=37326 RepID=UPI00245857E6
MVFVVVRVSITGSVTAAEAPKVKGTSAVSSGPARCSGASNGEGSRNGFGALRCLSFLRGRRDCFGGDPAALPEDAEPGDVAPGGVMPGDAMPGDAGVPVGEDDPDCAWPSCSGDAGGRSGVV